MGVITIRASNGAGSPNPTKKLVHQVDLLGQPLSRNNDLEFSRFEPPSLNPSDIRTRLLKYIQVHSGVFNQNTG